MAEPTLKQLNAAYGRLIVLMSLVWAATMMGAAVVDKASGEFIYLLLVLIGGAAVSGAVMESVRRRVSDLVRT